MRLVLVFAAVVTADQLVKALLPPLETTSRISVGLLLAAGAALLIVWRREAAPSRPPDSRARLALTVVTGGAAGNAIDIIFFGAVRDPLAVGPVALNVADGAMMAGLLLYAWMAVYDVRYGPDINSRR